MIPVIGPDQLTETLKQGGLDPKLFNSLLNGPLTYNVVYRRAHLCPCDDRGGADDKCPNCGGIGYYWTTPAATSTTGDAHTVTIARGSQFGEKIPPGSTPVQVSALEREHTFPLENLTAAQDGTLTWTGDDQPAQYELYVVAYAVTGSSIRALVQSVMTQREYQTRGTYEVTDLHITLDRHLRDGRTPNPAWEAAEHDRFTLLDTYRRYKSVLQRGVRDSVKYEHVRRATATILTPAGVLITYRQGEDFEMDGGRVVFPEGHGPNPRERFTLDCEVSPEYYVFQDLPQTRQMNGIDYPRKLVLRGFEAFPNRTATANGRGMP